MDTESIQKALTFFNFTTAYPILVKLTTDIYLNEVFHFTNSQGVSHRVQNEQKNQFLGPIWTISKYFKKLQHI